MDSKTQSKYDKLCKDFMVEFQQEEKEGTLTATLAISRAIKLHQLSSGYLITDDNVKIRVDNGRFEVLCGILDERPEGTKTIIWAHYRDTIDELEERLNKKYGEQSTAKVYGGMSSESRTANIQRFRSDKVCRTFIANPASAGWGITLTEADAAVYYSNSYNWEHRVQSEDRFHRIGQKASTVQYYDIIADGTIDERILTVLKEKANFSQSVMTDLGDWFGK